MLRCKACSTRTPSLLVRMIFRGAGTAPICPNCDRLKCPKCTRVLITGTERRCPGCRVDLRYAFIGAE